MFADFSNPSTLAQTGRMLRRAFPPPGDDDFAALLDSLTRATFGRPLPASTRPEAPSASGHFLRPARRCGLHMRRMGAVRRARARYRPLLV